MSGGSLNYFYQEVSDAAALIREKNTNYQGNDPVINAFADHLVKVSEALHDVEWVFSGDYSVDQCHESISKCLSSDHTQDMIKRHEREIMALEQLIVSHKKIIAKLDKTHFQEKKEGNQ